MVENGERFGRLEERMNKVEEGVANFREFQADARDFFTDVRTTAKNVKEFQETRDKEIKAALGKQNRNLTIIGIIIAALMAWFAYRDSQRKLSLETPPGVQSSQQLSDSPDPTQQRLTPHRP